jgi:hypothetical protein
MASAALSGEKTAATHSQTLSRGIRMLEILSEEISALSIGEVAERMGGAPLSCLQDSAYP